MPDLPDMPDQSAITPPDPSAIAASQPTPIPALDTPAPAAPTEAKPPIWRGILAGAMQGLAASGGATSLAGGISAGAQGQQKAFRQQQQDQQAQDYSDSLIRFRDASSAHLVAQAHADGARLESLPGELRDAANMRALAQVKQYQELGLEPTLVAESSNSGSTAGLQQLTQRDGAVGNNAYVNVGTHVYAFDLSQLANKPQGLTLINQDRVMTGLDPMDLPTFRQLGKQAQQKMVLDAVSRPLEQPGNGQEAAAMYQQWQNYKTTYAARKDADPTVLNQLDTKVKSLKKAQDYFDNRTVSMAQQTSQVKADAVQAAKPQSSGGLVVGFNPQSGEREIVSRDAAEAGNFEQAMPVKNADVEKWRSATSQFNDVQVNVSRYRQAVADYKGPISATDLTAMHSILNKAGVADADFAISEGGHIKLPLIASITEGISRQQKSDAYQSLSPQGKAIMDGYVRTMAAVPAYQKALTGIGRSNKEMLDLELANIPNPTMAPSDQERKLAAFQENIDQGVAGLPRIAGMQHPSDIRKAHEQSQKPAFNVPKFNQ